jgi:hypothetical protein
MLSTQNGMAYSTPRFSVYLDTGNCASFRDLANHWLAWQYGR